MKRILALLLCFMMLGSFLIQPVSALIYYVSYYEESIFAGGIVDLYAYPSEGNPEDFTYQWQFDAGFGDTGVAKYALLEPAADIRTLEQVFIVTEYSVG